MRLAHDCAKNQTLGELALSNLFDMTGEAHTTADIGDTHEAHRSRGVFVRIVAAGAGLVPPKRELPVEEDIAP